MIFIHPIKSPYYHEYPQSYNCKLLFIKKVINSIKFMEELSQQSFYFTPNHIKQ